MHQIAVENKQLNRDGLPACCTDAGYGWLVFNNIELLAFPADIGRKSAEPGLWEPAKLTRRPEPASYMPANVISF